MLIGALGVAILLDMLSLPLLYRIFFLLLIPLVWRVFGSQAVEPAGNED